MKYFRNIYQVVYFFVFWWAKKITKQLKPYKQRSWGKRRRRKRRRGGKRGRKRGRRWWGRIIVQKLKFEESLHVKKLKKKKKKISGQKPIQNDGSLIIWGALKASQLAFFIPLKEAKIGLICLIESLLQALPPLKETVNLTLTIIRECNN